MKIAVIGSGIAGLTVAWLLQQGGYQVTLYEREAAPGMDIHALEANIDQALSRLDIPIRTFNPGNWRNLAQLCKAAEVGMRPINMSHSFSVLDGATIFSYKETNIKQNYPALDNIRQLLKPLALKILTEAALFKHRSKGDVQLPPSVNMTLAEYLQYRGHSDAFIYNYFYPGLATICTCSYDHLDQYPAAVIINAIEKMFATFSLKRMIGGTQALVQQLTTRLHNLKCNHTITKIERLPLGVQIRLEDGQEVPYNHVVVATQANQALKLLAHPTEAEVEMLQSFSYDGVEVIVHNDPDRFMPRKPFDWAMINFMSRTNPNEAMSTVWVNRLDPLWRDKPMMFQTINPVIEPTPGSVVKRAYFERAVASHQSQRGVEMLHILNQQTNRCIWFCGSYAEKGIPLLESGVRSSLNIAAALGVPSPWDDEEI